MINNNTINEENIGEMQIEGKLYENIKQFDSQGSQIINFNGNIQGNPMQEIIIQTYKELKDDDIQVLEQIRRQQNEQEPKCQHIIQIIGIQDNRKTSQSNKEPKVYVVIEKGQQNLLNLIYQTKSISYIQKLKIFQQMVQGVKELQNLGYLLRDLKLENFVFFLNQNKEYKIKLIDFGFNNNTSKQSNMVPEQDSNFDKTAVIWSLGIILYKIFSKEDFIQGKKQLCNITQEQINEYIIKDKDLKLYEKNLIKNMLQIKNTERIQLETLLKEINIQIDELDQIKQQEKFKVQKQIQIEQNKLRLDFEQKNKIELDQMKRQLLQDKKQSLFNLFQFYSNTITIFNQNLNQKLQLIIDIDIQDQQKQQIITQINNELQKNNNKININSQKQQDIQYIQTQEMMQGQETNLINEIQCCIKNDINFINEIIEQQNQLQNKLINKQIIEEQRKEKDKSLNIEKQKYQQYFTIIQQKTNLYKGIQQQIQEQECIQDINIQQLNLIKYIQVLDQQEKKISQQQQLNQFIYYQSFNSILEELLQTQSSLKSSPNEKHQLNEQINKPQLQQVNEKIQIDDNNEQKREFNELNNLLQNDFIQFQKAQQSFKIACVDIEFYSQTNDNIQKMEQQFQEEIKTLEEYHQIYLKNTELFQEKLNQIVGNGILELKLKDIMKIQQQICEQKGIELCQVFDLVKEKQKELNLKSLTNPINTYEELKRQEEYLSNKLNQLNEIQFDQQLNPSSFKELKTQIQEQISNINEQTKNIPQNNEIQEYNNIYQHNLEEYDKLFALVNYIKSYHLKRYYKRTNRDIVNQQEIGNEESKVQDIFKRYQNFLFHNGNQIIIETMLIDQEQINEQIKEKEDLLKQVNLDKLTKQIKNQQIINEIIDIKKYYKIIEFAQMLILNSMMEMRQV